MSRILFGTSAARSPADRHLRTSAARNATVREVVVAMAVLFSAALSDNALAVFATGDYVTYGQADWGETPNGDNAAAILRDNFASILIILAVVSEATWRRCCGWRISKHIGA